MAATVLSKKQQKRLANEEANQASKGLLSGTYLFYTAVVVAVVGGGAIMQFLNMLVTTPFSKGETATNEPAAPITVSIPEIDYKNSDAVKNAVESGSPHVVYCVSNSTEAAQAPKVIGEIKRKVEKADADTKVVAINCFEKVESLNGTIAGLNNFGTRSEFLAVFANQEPPLQLNYLSSAKFVANQILPRVKVSVKPITYLADWQDCEQRKNGACLVIGGANREKRDEKVEVLQPYVRSHRAIKFVTVDTGFWKVKADKPLLSTRPTAPPSEEDPVNAFCVYKVKKPEAVNATVIGQFLKAWDDESQLQQFLDECNGAKAVEEGETAWAVMEEYPSLKAKSGKTKVVKRTKNPDAPEGEEDDGTKAGSGERVGRRKTEEEDDDDDDEDWAGEDEDGEGEELEEEAL